MQVYFRPPEYHTEISGRLLFPNIQDVPPTGFVDNILEATRAEDAERYLLWQQDLLSLMQRSNEYLCSLSAVDGCAILYYKSYPIRRRREAKKCNVPTHIFSFGFVARTEADESGLQFWLEKNFSVKTEQHGHGLSTKVLREVAQPFVWRSNPTVGSSTYSHYSFILSNVLPSSRWYGWHGYYAFGIPAEECALVPQQ